MQIEDQVCSLELAKRLKELGVKQESYFKWRKVCHEFELKNEVYDEWHKSEFCYSECQCESDEKYSAFSVAELGAMLPVHIEIKSSYLRLDFSKSMSATECETGNLGTRFSYHRLIEKEGFSYDTRYCNHEKVFLQEFSNKEANTRAKMLVHLIESGLMEIQK